MKKRNPARKRRLMEKQLGRSEERFRQIYEASMNAIYTTSVQGEIVNVNPAGVSMFGVDSLDELRKVPVVDLYVNPEDRRRFIELMDKGPVRGFETRLKREDGRILHVIINAYPLKDEKGRVTKFQGALVNITERKLLEKELSRSKRFLEEVIDNVLDPMFIKDKDFKYVLANQAYFDFGRSKNSEKFCTSRNY